MRPNRRTRVQMIYNGALVLAILALPVGMVQAQGHRGRYGRRGHCGVGMQFGGGAMPFGGIALLFGGGVGVMTYGGGMQFGGVGMQFAGGYMQFGAVGVMNYGGGVYRGGDSYDEQTIDHASTVQQSGMATQSATAFSGEGRNFGTGQPACIGRTRSAWALGLLITASMSPARISTSANFLREPIPGIASWAPLMRETDSWGSTALLPMGISGLGATISGVQTSSAPETSFAE